MFVGALVCSTSFAQNATTSQPENGVKRSNLYVKTTSLLGTSEGLELNITTEENNEERIDTYGPYSLEDTIPEAYGLKNKLAEMQHSGLNIVGTQITQLDIEGEYIRYLLKSTNHDTLSTASNGTFFYDEEFMPEQFTDDSYFSVLKVGNEGLPQVNMTFITPKKLTTQPNAQEWADTLAKRITNIQSPNLIKAGKVNAKGRSDFYAFRFDKPVNFLVPFMLIDRELLESSTDDRFREIQEVLQRVRQPMKKAYEHFIAIQYDERAYSSSYTVNIALFSTKRSLRPPTDDSVELVE